VGKVIAMHLHYLVRRAVVPAIAIGVFACLAAAPADTATVPPGFTAHRGYTQASASRDLSLKVPGIVWAVNVKPGDKVRKDQELLSLDDRDEQVNKEIYKLEAESNVAVRTAEAKLRFAQNELEKKKAKGEDVYSKQEIEEAKLNVELAELEIAKAKEEQAKAGLAYKRQGAMLAQMRIISTIDGEVRKRWSPERERCLSRTRRPLWLRRSIRCGLRRCFRLQSAGR
jgi:multidrug efflux pump subunit AcrA (membrane-fusion protein)